MRRSIAILGILVLVATALAQSGPTQVELVLDASGSMWNRVADGRYRIEAAKDALTTFVRALPDAGLDVGLRIYGSTVDALDPRGCDDTRLFVPLAPVDKGALQGAVDAVAARGATPIAASLLAAAADFAPDASRKVIVLVTDGEESCGGDLRAAVDQLAAAQIAVELRIIGFDLPPRAAEAFASLADFTNAADAAALEGAVEDVVADAPPIPAPTPARVTLVAPDRVPAGTAYEVRWSGDSVDGDAIVVVPSGAPDDATGTLLGYVGESDRIAGTAPLAPARLELRYLSVGTIAARKALEITPSPATIRVEDDAVFAGSGFTVAWTGPDGPSDYVTLVAPDAPDGDYGAYVYTREGAELGFTAPSDPGSYELRYQSDDDPGTVLARTRVEVLPPKPITLEAAREVVAGAPVEVHWTGPDAERDYVTIAPSGAPEGTYLSYAYTRDGDPLTLTAPQRPGAYELRYSTDRSDAKGRVYASTPLTVVAADIALTPGPEIRAGSPFEVGVTGPAHGGDYVTIVRPDAEAGSYDSYAYVDEPTTTVTLLAPADPGSYELRYQSESDPNTVLARVPVTVGAPVPVTLEAPDEASPGDTIEVRWTGPGGPSDYLTIVDAGAPDGEYGAYAYTRDGSPLALPVPAEPGRYEIRYQSDRSEVGVLARRTLTVR